MIREPPLSLRRGGSFMSGSAAQTHSGSDRTGVSFLDHLSLVISGSSNEPIWHEITLSFRWGGSFGFQLSRLVSGGCGRSVAIDHVGRNFPCAVSGRAPDHQIFAGFDDRAFRAVKG